MSGTFQYLNPPVVHWGAGSAARLPGELRRLGGGPVALVTTRSLLAAPPVDAVCTVCVGQHAPEAEIEAAVVAVAGSGAGAIVSHGGGSPIDAAKIVGIRVAEGRGLAEGRLPHVALPTTLSVAELAAGAGYTSAAGDKLGLRDPRGLPDAVIYDARLTLATPMELWLSTGIRALDHAVEGFLAEGEHPFSDVMALEAIRLLFESLPAARDRPRDLEVRTRNQLAAWFSYTLPGPTASGLSHVMGKQIGARHAIPHGVTSCLLMPHVMRFMARVKPERCSHLPSPDEVEGLIASLGLPRRISAFGVGRAELEEAARALAGRHSEQDLAAIYLEAL